MKYGSVDHVNQLEQALKDREAAIEMLIHRLQDCIDGTTHAFGNAEITIAELRKKWAEGK